MSIKKPLKPFKSLSGTFLFGAPERNQSSAHGPVEIASLYCNEIQSYKLLVFSCWI